MSVGFHELSTSWGLDNKSFVCLAEQLSLVPNLREPLQFLLSYSEMQAISVQPNEVSICMQSRVLATFPTLQQPSSTSFRGNHPPTSVTVY